MKPRPGELGTYNPRTRQYEAVLTHEEEVEEFQREHENDEREEIVIDDSSLSTGQMLPASRQPDTYNPYTKRYEKAGYREDE